MINKLANVLREETSDLHRQAEETGIVRQIISGNVDRRLYAVYLRNLLPAYQQLEKGLEKAAGHPALRRARQPSLYRSAAVVEDLMALSGEDWQSQLLMLDSGVRYAEDISAASVRGSALIAHAYVRFLGDLNGGLMIRKILADRGRFTANELKFFDYAGLASLPKAAMRYRTAINDAGQHIDQWDEIVAEACLAFRRNTEISVDTLNAAPAPQL